MLISGLVLQSTKKVAAHALSSLTTAMYRGLALMQTGRGPVVGLLRYKKASDVEKHQIEKAWGL